MGKDVHNQYDFYPGNAISLIDATSFIKKYPNTNLFRGRWMQNVCRSLY